MKKIVKKLSVYWGVPNLYNIKAISLAALMVAISVLAGKFLAIPRDGSVRFSLENFPILLSGMIFGPILGALVGVLADFVGCIVVGFSINPIIMAGCACVGLISGILFKIPVRSIKLRLLVSVAVSHVAASIFIKSIGLCVYYGYNMMITVLWRTLNYSIIGVVEFILLYLLFKNTGFRALINRFIGVRK